MYEVDIFLSSRGLFTTTFESTEGKAVQQQHRGAYTSAVPPSWFLPPKIPNLTFMFVRVNVFS